MGFDLLIDETTATNIKQLLAERILCNWASGTIRSDNFSFSESRPLPAQKNENKVTDIKTHQLYKKKPSETISNEALKRIASDFKQIKKFVVNAQCLHN